MTAHKHQATGINIATAYRGSKNRDDFKRELGRLGVDIDPDVLWAVCNQCFHHGYAEGRRDE